MLQCAARRAVARVANGPTSGVAAMATSGLKGFSEHETAVENQYFSKEDERVLRNLLNKVKKQSDQTDVAAAAGVQASEEAALRGIVGKYKITSEDVKALLQWKHTVY